MFSNASKQTPFKGQFVGGDSSLCRGGLLDRVHDMGDFSQVVGAPLVDGCEPVA